MSPVFRFGEALPEYPVPVLNERAVRAGAGILFVLAFGSFMNAWLVGNFQPTRVFVVAFLLDFTLRIFVSPRYAPSLILGQWAVRHQQPEWSGAPQKRFAWGIGFALALTMFWLLVVQNVVGPANVLVCAACLVLMFFEAAFGIRLPQTKRSLHARRACWSQCLNLPRLSMACCTRPRRASVQACCKPTQVQWAGSDPVPCHAQRLQVFGLAL